MKTRESGMPDESAWASFFSPDETLHKLGLGAESGDVVDFGCGYGTFAIAAAKIVRGTVYAIDIEPEMVETTRRNADREDLTNLRATLRDFTASGTGLGDTSVGYAMMFNILHCERPDVLLREARRVLAPDGVLAVTHWNSDPATPRGPSMAIRPEPAACKLLAEAAGFAQVGPSLIDLPPYHYGLTFRKPVL